MKETTSGTKTRAMQTVEDCMEAYKQCITGLAHCLSYADGRNTGEHIRLLMDAADINLATANYVTRASRFHRRMLELCAEVNHMLADTLVGLEREDATLKVVYAACLRAATGCNEMLDKSLIDRGDDRDHAVWESFPASDTPPTVSRS